jgi:hypothetical protein
MYQITINHRGGDKVRTYTVYRQDEADEEGLSYLPWKRAEIGDYALSDDGYVAKVINKAEYPGNRGFSNIYIRFPWGYTFFNTQYPTRKLNAQGRKTNTTMSGKPYIDVKMKSQKYRNFAMTYAMCNMQADLAIDVCFGAVDDRERRKYRRTIRTEAFKNMVREELSSLLTEHGMTEDYTLDLLEQTITKAKDKGDITNLMRAIENLQDMHGMKDKHLVKTTDKLEATSSVKLIDELREEEQKLVATRTTLEEAPEDDKEEKEE